MKKTAESKMIRLPRVLGLFSIICQLTVLDANAASSEKGFTVRGEMSNQISISRVGDYFGKGQFNVQPNDYGIIITLWKPEHPSAQSKNRCGSFVYDQFGTRKDGNLISLQKEYASNLGEIVVLENVRMSSRSGMCVFSRLRFEARPEPTRDVEVTGNVVQVAERKHEVFVRLKAVKAEGFNTAKCKSFFAIINNSQTILDIDKAKLRGRITLKDVRHSERQWHCSFDWSKTVSSIKN